MQSIDHQTPTIANQAEVFAAPTYEDRLSRDSRWALSEGSLFFEGKGAVQAALLKIADRLNELGIDYAVAGGMALFKHGLRRFTEDVDILVTREALLEIHGKLEGLGYLPPFEGSKNLRDTVNGVKIEFLVTGDYPGDGKPKPVAFPNPANVAVNIDGVWCLTLPSLVELKLASGMTNTLRMKDLNDVHELIMLFALPRTFADKLHPFVQAKFGELWMAAQPKSTRFVTLARGKGTLSDSSSIEETVSSLELAEPRIREMLADGVAIDHVRGGADGVVYLLTTDPVVARKYDMHDESELLRP